MNLQATIIFKQLWAGIQAKNPDGTRRYNGFALEGGSRSSKTTSIIQAILLYCIQSDEELRISAFRQKATWVTETVWKDFVDYLKSIDYYNNAMSTLRPPTYKIDGSIVEFGGLDDDQRLHGRKQNIFWINEAIESALESFDQLEMRTTDFWILDWNPKATEHWLFEKVIKRDDVLYIHSTMLDNPFLEAKIREKILSYEPTPENINKGTANEYNWQVYGLGIRAKREGLVFENFEEGVFDDSLVFGYGMDFGFTQDPTCLIKVAISESESKIYVKEYLYKTGLTSSTIDEIFGGLSITKHDLIIGDSAEPRLIYELQELGWNIERSIKGKDSIRKGIAEMNNYKIIIDPSSENLLKEFNNYIWSDKRSNTPIDKWNHGIDAIRYAIEKLIQKDNALIYW